MRDKQTLYCFLDTNTLLHYQLFDEVDWPKHFAASDVRLMLTPSVMRELDKFKDDHTNERRNKRARTVVSKLDKLFAASADGSPAPVRAGVSIEDIAREPQIDWPGVGLDPDVQDDRLLATIIEFRAQHPAARLELVSRDFGVRRKARRHGIATRNREDLLEPIALATPEEAKIQRLERENRELRHRLPQLRVGFAEAGQRAAHLTHAVPPY